MEALWLPLWTSLRVACSSTLLALPAGVGLAWLAVNGRFRRAEWLDLVILFPLLMPAPVLGYCLLVSLDKSGSLLFTETAAVLAAAIYTVPLTALLATRAFRETDPSFAMLARILGAPSWRIFLRVSVPLAAKPLAAIALLSLARSLGDFGITLLVARRLPNGASTLPIALYQALEAGQGGAALGFAIVLMALVILLLAAAYFVRARRLLP